MVIEEGIGASGVMGSLNFTEVIGVISPSLAENLGGVILFLKALGIVFIFYVIYLLANAFFNIRNRRRMKDIERKVNDIDKKITRIGSLLETRLNKKKK